MNLYLLRHGETDWNRTGRLQGHTDIPLNQTGKMQIRQAAKELANMGVDIELILSSPLKRAFESAEIAADELSYKEDILVESLLIERHFGKGEGLTLDERNERYPDFLFPEMESFEDLIARAHTVFDKIVTDYKDRQNILVVAHGAILSAMVTAITGGKIAYFGKTVQFDQGSIHLIKYLDGAIEIARYNQAVKAFMIIDY